jgi:hypothetical protein
VTGIPSSQFLILNFLLLFVFLVAAGCGRKGPPLPPLVRVPVAPGDLTATRRGQTVELKFVVPSANNDQTRPANIERVDIYALTASARVPDTEVVRRGERVASINVKAPRDPDQTIDPDEPAADLEPLRGQGPDQGATTEAFEDLSAFTPGGSKTVESRIADGRPLVGPSCQLATRTYVGVGVSLQGRRGPLSRQVSVPLGPAPAAPQRPTVRYDESGVTIGWGTGRAGGSSEAPAILPLDARVLGCGAPTTGYHVYEVGAAQFETRLTDKPAAGPPFVDRRLEWGVERCYTVRTVESIGGLPVESDPAAPACEKLVDTFAPAAPKGLITVASVGEINLMWDANPEKDVAGYIVLRAPAAGQDFTPVTPGPVRETSFIDKVQAGTPFIYAIQAVDANGNRSASSAASPAESAR